MWSHWGPPHEAFQAGRQDKCSKLIGQNIMSLSFRSSQTDKSKYLLNRNLTPCLFPSFMPDYEITANLIFLKCHLSTTLRPLHLRSTQDSSCSFTYSSFSGYRLSLPPSPPSALRLSLCWMQPETRSPLLFPGSHPLCFQAWPGKTLSSPLPLGVTISSPPWLSQVLALSMSHINAQHADNHIQYRLAQ